MKTVSYRSLGLSNTGEMFQKAFTEKYAVPAYNFNNMEQLQAIIAACVQTASPVILQVSGGARKYADQTLLRYMAQGAVAAAHRSAMESLGPTLRLMAGTFREVARRRSAL